MKQLKKPDKSFAAMSGLSNNTDSYCSKKPAIREGTKEHVILSALVAGQSLNRFEAARLHDTCLNSTISKLQGKGISIHREFEKVRCVNGTKTTDVMRYKLLPHEIEKAERLLGVAA